MALMYTVYLLLCADNTYYTGITTDIVRRLEEHNTSKKGARYTQSRRPVTLIYQETASDRSQAQRREYALRKLSHLGKTALAATQQAQY